MKTLKLVLVAALVMFTMTSFADNGKNVVRNVIQLKVAMTDPGLCTAIMMQVNPGDLLNNETNHPLYVSVYYRGNMLAIVGSYAEWFKFFKLRIRPGISSESAEKSIKKIE